MTANGGTYRMLLCKTYSIIRHILGISGHHTGPCKTSRSCILEFIKVCPQWRDYLSHTWLKVSLVLRSPQRSSLRKSRKEDCSTIRRSSICTPLNFDQPQYLHGATQCHSH
jgi:hypothetical protein